MKFSYNLTVDDWAAFQQYYRGKKHPFYSAVYPMILSLSAILLTTNIYYVYLYGFSKLTLISAIVLIILLYVLQIRKKSLETIKNAGLELERKHPEAFGMMNIELNENGIDIKSQQTSKYMTWDEMDKFEENKKYFFLYSKKGMVYIVPKQEINDMVSSFRNNLINYIS